MEAQTGNTGRRTFISNTSVQERVILSVLAKDLASRGQILREYAQDDMIDRTRWWLPPTCASALRQRLSYKDAAAAGEFTARAANPATSCTRSSPGVRSPSCK